MITRMKKMQFVVYHKDYEQFLERLRELGVVHVVTHPLADEATADMDDMLKRRERLTAVAAALRQLVGKEQLVDKLEADVVLDEYDRLTAAIAVSKGEAEQMARDIEALTPWGDFDNVVLGHLAQAGYTVRFYTCPAKAYNAEWEEAYNAVVVDERKGTLRLITIAHTDVTPEMPGAVEAVLPQQRLNDLLQAHENNAATQQQLNDDLHTLAVEGLKAVEDALAALDANIDFDRVKYGTESAATGKVMVLDGWAPAVTVDDVLAATTQAYSQVSDPTPDDEIPIQLKNDAFTRMFEPIMNLYMLPKYSELDLTPFFAPFYMLFFGLCLGDSGYGLFILLAAIAARVKIKSADMRVYANLVITLGISSVLCGLLSGSFFGFNMYEEGWPLIDRAEQWVHVENSNMFNLALGLGVVQILFGMCIKVANRWIQFGFGYAVSTIGWLLFLVCGALSLAAPAVPQAPLQYGMAAGLAAAFLYNSPAEYSSPVKGLFINIGLGLWDAYNTATGLLGDILSYVRLFALGLSGGILATVFNSLASGFSPDVAVLGPAVWIIIFFIGHALNIFMSALGAMVHPLRLTFVEFFKNAGFDGGGVEYKPFGARN